VLGRFSRVVTVSPSALDSDAQDTVDPATDSFATTAATRPA